MSAEKALLEKVKKWILALYDIRYNEVANRLEFKLKELNEEWKYLKDSAVSDLLLEMIDNDIVISLSGLKLLLNSGFVPTYNPFRDYLDKLSEWDGKDYIVRLASRITTKDDQLLLLYLKRWLVGVVACCYDDKVINENVFILLGPQRIGKTRFLRSLVPAILWRYYHEGWLNFKNKDHLLLLSSCLLINFDEFENIVSGNIEEFKSMISTVNRRIRRPYAAVAEDFPRRCSFCATINKAVFLKDPTGNRRFLVIESTAIDNESEFNYLDGIYSQALHLWRSRERFYFNEEETDLINEHNMQYELALPEFEAIRTYIRPKNDQDTAFESMTATGLARLLGSRIKMQVTNGFVQKVGTALRSLGFIPRRSNGNQVYDFVQIA